MSETTILWIFGALMLMGGGWMAWLTKSIEQITNNHTNLDSLVKQIRMAMIMISEQAAKLLHADDNFHGMDDLIDKLIDPKQDLTQEKMFGLLNLAEQAMNNQNFSKHDRFLAAIIFHVNRNLTNQETLNEKTP